MSETTPSETTEARLCPCGCGKPAAECTCGPNCGCSCNEPCTCGCDCTTGKCTCGSECECGCNEARPEAEAKAKEGGCCCGDK
ncbi:MULTISPECIES: hypothetical protein [Luteococcus]|uniref:Uncharacterized protein n=1 Tax=Luteococcus japonicus LSP_Lj1 TaxID=1255658 RepID=A0A1R4J9L3_9ACTN|nr:MULTISPECIES: hypothetical protein [Luteococcus]MDN5563271.1 hypothetical protein [Luteococcus sp.]SJN28373.1 hypothetical protein FM114_06130 [Luteococcus japonicus LSP_Lj1]